MLKFFSSLGLLLMLTASLYAQGNRRDYNRQNGNGGYHNYGNYHNNYSTVYPQHGYAGPAITLHTPPFLGPVAPQVWHAGYGFPAVGPTIVVTHRKCWHSDGYY